MNRNIITLLLSSIMVLLVVFSILLPLTLASNTSITSNRKTLPKDLRSSIDRAKVKELISKRLATSSSSCNIALVTYSDFSTVIDDLEELLNYGIISCYDVYTENNIDDLWARLDQYEYVFIDEDCMYRWTNPDPNSQHPIPWTPIGQSFYNHREELKEWIYNGGKLFVADNNDISVNASITASIYWEFLPDELKPLSNQYPSNYEETGIYGHDPTKLVVASNSRAQRLFSYPNQIDLSQVSSYECHGRFDWWPSIYEPAVIDSETGDVLELIGHYGKGVIIVTHLEYETADVYTPSGRTWDSLYIENELNYMQTVEKKISLTLYIDDATQPQNTPPMVVKLPGMMMEIIAIVNNSETTAQEINVSLVLPDLSWDVVKVYRRRTWFDPLQTDLSYTYIPPNTYVTTVTVNPSEVLQVVFRVKLPDTIDEGKYSIEVRISVSEGLVGMAKRDILVKHSVDVIWVTNRHRTFETLMPGIDIVERTLSYLYALSAPSNTYTGYIGSVLYVDWYDQTLENWNPNNVDYTNESTANTYAMRVRNIILRFAYDSSTDSLKTKYIVIVGNDEVVPFFRIRSPTNDEPNVCSYSPPYKYGYIFTDLPYQAIGKIDLSNIKASQLRLIVGRIPLISEYSYFVNAVKGPANVKTAIVGSMAAIADILDSDIAADRLRAVGYTVPIKCDYWGPIPVACYPIEYNTPENKMLEIYRENSFALIAVGGHSCGNGIHNTDGSLGFLNIPVNDNWREVWRKISELRSIMILLGCHAGDPQKNLVYYTNVYNVPLLIAPTSYASYNALNDVRIGDEDFLFYILFTKVIEERWQFGWPPHYYVIARNFGEALLEAKKEVVEAPSSWNLWYRLFGNMYKKAAYQETLYGFPWIRLPDPTPSTNTSEPPKDYSVDIEYLQNRIVIHINIHNYTINHTAEGDVLIIRGAKYWSEETNSNGPTRAYRPTIPYIIIKIPLPYSTNISIDSAVVLDNKSIGILDLFTNTSGLGTSIIPYPFYGIANYTDNVSTHLLLYVALAQWNPVSRETFLLNNTYIALDLESLRNLSLVDVFTSRDEYIPGENITLFIDIVNIGGFNTTAYINISLENIVSYVYRVPIQNGENTIVLNFTLPNDIEAKSYRLKVDLLDSNNVTIGSRYLIIRVKNIDTIVNYTDHTYVGKPINITVIIRNYKYKDIEANIHITIYNSKGAIVYEGYGKAISIASHSEGNISKIISTSGWKPGKYTIQIWIHTWQSPQGRVYGPIIGSLSLDPPPSVGGGIGIENTGGVELYSICYMVLICIALLLIAIRLIYLYGIRSVDRLH